MRVALLTREFPPDVYGGAGVHVDYLSRALRPIVALDIHCMGGRRSGATAHPEDDPRLAGANPALRTLSADLAMVAAVSGTAPGRDPGPDPDADADADADAGAGAELVHSHTWYTNLAGHLAKLTYGIPHVLTAHSLEPLRPWKAEQLGGGYRLSTWAERTGYETADAVIAVSAAMRDDILECYPGLDPASVHVVHNGIDTGEYRPEPSTEILRRLGVSPSRPYVCFVGRITRQKGLPHLLRAAAHFPPEVQIVLLAGAADTPELARETADLVAGLRATREGVFWVERMLPRPEVRSVLTHAAAFCCPSLYEPQGIVNLEAMACGTAVVASAVGGIPEVVRDQETGLLVPYDPADPAAFERGLAETVGDLVRDPDRAERMGRAGRARAIAGFGWDAIAARTVEIYRTVAGEGRDGQPR